MVAALKADPAGWYREHGLELPSALAKQAPQAVHAGHLAAEAGATQGCLMHVCPMHEDVCQSSAGNCPRCGMALEPIAASTQAGEYTCPMHPEVAADAPGRCPKCGMTLELRDATGAHHA
jgi:hypothetical protein